MKPLEELAQLCREYGLSLSVDRTDVAAIRRAFANPCMYCGSDDDEVPYEDTDAHRNTSQHQYAVLDS